MLSLLLSCICDSSEGAGHESYVVWVARLLRLCVYTDEPLDLAAAAFLGIHFVAWFFLFYPQLYRTHTLRFSASVSVSVLYLTLWCLSEVCFLISTVLQRWSLFWILFRVYRTGMTLLITGQVVYFRYYASPQDKLPRVQDLDEDMEASLRDQMPLSPMGTPLVLHTRGRRNTRLSVVGVGDEHYYLQQDEYGYEEGSEYECDIDSPMYRSPRLAKGWPKRAPQQVGASSHAVQTNATNQGGYARPIPLPASSSSSVHPIPRYSPTGSPSSPPASSLSRQQQKEKQKQKQNKAKKYGINSSSALGVSLLSQEDEESEAYGRQRHKHAAASSSSFSHPHSSSVLSSSLSRGTSLTAASPRDAPLISPPSSLPGRSALHVQYDGAHLTSSSPPRVHHSRPAPDELQSMLPSSPSYSAVSISSRSASASASRKSSAAFQTSPTSAFRPVGQFAVEQMQQQQGWQLPPPALEEGGAGVAEESQAAEVAASSGEDHAAPASPSFSSSSPASSSAAKLASLATISFCMVGLTVYGMSGGMGDDALGATPSSLSSSSAAARTLLSSVDLPSFLDGATSSPEYCNEYYSPTAPTTYLIRIFSWLGCGLACASFFPQFLMADYTRSTLGLSFRMYGPMLVANISWVLANVLPVHNDWLRNRYKQHDQPDQYGRLFPSGSSSAEPPHTGAESAVGPPIEDGFYFYYVVVPLLIAHAFNFLQIWVLVVQRRRFRKEREWALLGL